MFQKMKDAGKKGVDLTKKAGKKGVDLGKKGASKTKETVRKKTCVECTHYTPKDDSSGECPIAGARMGSADAGTCPQKAFKPK